MITNYKSPVQFLREALSERVGANPRYSLRAFARDLGMSPQQLSNVLNGRKGISRRYALQIATRLGLSPAETEYLCDLTQSFWGTSKATKKLAHAKVVSAQAQFQKSTRLTQDAFRVISDWYHFGLVELLKASDKTLTNEAVLAKKLGIPASEVRMGLSRLQNLELITHVRPGHWKVNQDTVLTTDGVPSEALRKFHKQVIARAMLAVTEQSLEERYLSSSIVAVKTSKMKKAAELIQKFRMDFAECVTHENQGEEVYALGIQYFRLSNKTNEEKQ